MKKATTQSKTKRVILDESNKLSHRDECPISGIYFKSFRDTQQAFKKGKTTAKDWSEIQKELDDKFSSVNADTIDAMNELKAGKGKQFNSVDELFDNI